MGMGIIDTSENIIAFENKEYTLRYGNTTTGNNGK